MKLKRVRFYTNRGSLPDFINEKLADLQTEGCTPLGVQVVPYGDADTVIIFYEMDVRER